MDKKQIKSFIGELEKTKERNIVVIDFANIDRWENSLGWKIGIEKLGQLSKHFTYGKKFLRRFYYGEDYGPKDKSKQLTPWSEKIKMNAR